MLRVILRFFGFSGFTVSNIKIDISKICKKILSLIFS